VISSSGSALYLNQAAHVVSDVRETDLCLGAGDADGPDGQAKDIFLNRINMLDGRSVLGPCAIPAPDVLRHGTALGFAVVDVTCEALFVDEGLILL